MFFVPGVTFVQPLGFCLFWRSVGRAQVGFRLPGGRQSGSILGRHHTIHSQKAGAGLGRLSGDHIVGGMRGLPHRAIALLQVRVPPRVASKIVAPWCEGRPGAVRGFPRFESCRDLVLKFPDGF